MISFTVNDTKYTMDETRLTAVEGRTIKKNTGMPMLEFLNGILTGDGDSITGLVWIAKCRAGEKVAWEDLDDIDLITLLASLEYIPDKPTASEPATVPEVVVPEVVVPEVVVPLEVPD